jgi:carbonic anhydrase
MVVATDVNLKSALQYAVTVLKVKHIIVCGHYDCGGIRASTRKMDIGAPLEMWIRNIRDVYRMNQAELDAIKDPEDRHRRMVEINAVEQCVNLFKTGVVQRMRLETAKDPDCKFPAPRIHAVVYNPKDGRLKELDVNWHEYLHDLRGIYEMYGSEVEIGVPDEEDPEKHNKRKAIKSFFGMESK